jgi:hypothetical protein
MNSSKKIKSSKTKSRTKTELDEFSAALDLANAAQASAAKARAEATKAVADAERAIFEAINKGEALQERLRAAKAHEDTQSANAKFDELDWSIHSDLRERRLLVTALGMLGSGDIVERAAAVLIAERQRSKLGMTWDELVVNDQDGCDLDEDELDDDDELDDEDEDRDWKCHEAGEQPN